MTEYLTATREKGYDMIEKLGLPFSIMLHLAETFDELMDTCDDICGEAGANRAIGKIEGMLLILTENDSISEDDAAELHMLCEKILFGDGKEE